MSVASHQNKRNSKEDVEPMTSEEKKHFNKRIVVEQHFGHLKQFKSIIIRYERYVNHYINMINIAYSTIICRKITLP